LLTFDQTTG